MFLFQSISCFIVVLATVLAGAGAKNDGFLLKRLAKQSSSNSVISVSLNLTALSESELNGTCNGGPAAGLGETTLRLEYRSENEHGVTWTEVEDNIPLDSGTAKFRIRDSQALTKDDQPCIRFRFVQEEHGGAFCNCWTMDNLKVEIMGTSTEIRFSSDWKSLCQISASVRRILTCTYCNNNASGSCTTMTDTDPLETPFSINSCSDTTPRLRIFFQALLKGNGSCDKIENPNEGIEFSASFDEKTWIPVTVIYAAGNTSKGLPIGNFSNLVIRDYYVRNQVETQGKQNVNVFLTLCNFERQSEFIQFRWLQSASYTPSDDVPRDFWGLDDLRISEIDKNGKEMNLLSDSFDEEELNPRVWPMEGIRDADLSTICTGENQALTFGLIKGEGKPARASRSIKTAPIPLSSNQADTVKGSFLLLNNAVILSFLSTLSLLY